MGASSETIGGIVNRRRRSIIIEPAAHYPGEWGVRTSKTFGYLFQGTFEECVRYLADNLPAPLEGETVEGSLYSTADDRGNLVLRGGERIPVHTPDPLDIWFLGADKVTLVLGHLKDGAYTIKTASRPPSRPPFNADGVLITWTNPNTEEN